MTVSMSRLVPQPLGLRDGTFAILAAVASNTVSKLVDRRQRWGAGALPSTSR